MVIQVRDGSADAQLSLEKLGLAGTPGWRGDWAKVKGGIGGTSRSRYESNGRASSLLTECLCEDCGLYLLIALSLGVLWEGQWKR